MLFDQNESLVYFNDDAKHEFDLAEEAYDKPSYYMIRDLQIKQAISDVNHDHQNRVFDVKHDGKTLEVKVFHVDAEGHNKTKATVLVLIKDVTQERAIEQIKRDFFSHASHELKSPLTAIKGLAELIEQHMVQDQEIDQTAQKIVKQTETMTALVEDMLMLSRLENLKEKSYVMVDVVQLLNDVVDSLKPLAESKSMKLHTKTVPYQGYCDPVDLQKLFKNLIENAIKYSEDHKKVDITLSNDQDMMVFSVKDQGIGIAVEHQQRVFERFYRVDKGRLDGGTGLGLAIVKHISMKYDGTIDLKSSLSRGTTVTVKMHI
jgi:two-component system phosphate regulon sensor histidine kinase PhoR